MRAQEQQRLPTLELFNFTGKPIDWPKFIERFRDQIHNTTTLADSDRMAYLFQNLDGEAKEAVQSLGVTGHSYAAALKTLKRQFGNPNSVATAYLSNMLDSTLVSLNNRQAFRDYYYQVKACTTWCAKMGQSAILQTPEYLSRATMRLPMHLRVRWYEHIDGRTDKSNVVEFERWLHKRVDPLFNPKTPCLKPKSSIKFHLLATGTELPNEVLVESDAITDLKQTPQLHPLAMATGLLTEVRRHSNVSYNSKQGQANFQNKEAERNAQSNRTKCVVCILLCLVLCLNPINSLSLRTVPTIVIAHTFCPS